MLNEPVQDCPCGSEQTYKVCCEKFINDAQFPGDPEHLMRSRYTAYSLKNENYLLKTWHESTRPTSLELKNDTTQWKLLKIISTSDNMVNFVAYFTQDSLNKEKIYALTEISEFIKNKKWFYLQGKEVKTVQLTKNMPCPCQSGKKYKRCCEKSLSF